MTKIRGFELVSTYTNQDLLPKRETLILTRNSEEKIDGVTTFQDVQSVLDWYQAQDKNLYILGGKQIFSSF